MGNERHKEHHIRKETEALSVLQEICASIGQHVGGSVCGYRCGNALCIKFCTNFEKKIS